MSRGELGPDVGVRGSLDLMWPFEGEGGLTRCGLDLRGFVVFCYCHVIWTSSKRVGFAGALFSGWGPCQCCFGVLKCRVFRARFLQPFGTKCGLIWTVLGDMS